ncbi:MAG: hypothetical protein HY904_21020 [Deltaproteobacteria bacterium]|nr:hypothetical protein [Deltaproteobacteria bacterium]
MAPPPASAPPTPPEVAAILPPDQPTPPVQLLNPPNPRMLTAMQDPEGPAARAAAQQAAQQAQEETGWSKPLIGAGVAVMVPAILLGVLALGGVMAGITLSIASYATARNINAEIKSVPHKNNGAFPLSSLITLGQWLERATFLLLGGGGLLGVLGSVITVAGLVGGIGLIVAANPKVRGAPAAPPPASGSRPASPSSTAAPPAPAPAPGSTP